MKTWFAPLRHVQQKAPVSVAVLILSLGVVGGCGRAPQAENVAPGTVLLGTGGNGSGTGGIGVPGTDGGAGQPDEMPEPGGTGGIPGTPYPDSGALPDPDPGSPGDGGAPADAAPEDTSSSQPDADPDVAPPPPPPPVQAPDLARGRIAHWRLDETRGKTAADTCGIGNHGTGIGFVDSDWRVARVNNGLNFTPARHTVLEVKTHETLQPPSWLSMSLWVRALAWDNRPRLVQKGNADEQYSLSVEGGQLRFAVRLVGGKIAVVTAPAPALNKWIHVAALFDGWKAQLFVGGVLVATKDALGYPQGTLQVLSIGGRSGASEIEHYYGMLDDIILYNRPLSPEEIRLASTGRSP